MTNCCPFCHEDMSKYADVANRKRLEIAMHGDTVTTCIMLCMKCGEPIANDGNGFRKPSDFEYENFITTPAVQFGRARWQLSQKYDYPLFKGWQELEKKIKEAEDGMNRKASEAQRRVLLGVYLLGAMQTADAMKKAINDESLDDIYTSAQISLIDDEIRNEIDKSNMEDSPEKLTMKATVIRL